MKNSFLLGVLLGSIVATIISLSISSVFAKYESGSRDAKSTVGYGYYNETIKSFNVSADGTLQITN